MNEDSQRSIQRAAELIKNAEGILITAGAGLGVDSGLPDFRGNEGFWNNYPPMKKLGLSFREMANPIWFQKDPTLAWGFYGHRMNLYRKTIPHEGFHILKKLAENKPSGYFVYTSNVDGQFQKAGFSEDRIVECHGSLTHVQCMENIHNVDYLWPSDQVQVDIDETTFRVVGKLPECLCGGMARPNVLMFNDYYWNDARCVVQERRYHNWMEEIGKKKHKLVIIEMGAGSTIPSIRYQSETIYQLVPGCSLIRINPRESAIPFAERNVSLPMGAKDSLRLIYQELEGTSFHL